MFGGKMVAELHALDREFCAFATHVLGAVEGHAEPPLWGDRGAPTARDVTDRGQRILLLYQPVAADFRQVVATLRMAGELERVEQLAHDIADDLVDATALPGPWRCDVERTRGVVARALCAVLSAYEGNDYSAARRALKLCRSVPALVAELTDRLAALMKADPAAVEPGLRMFAVVRNLRLVARHVLGFAELECVRSEDGCKPLV